MRIHYLQHVPFEGLGGMHAWFGDRSAKVVLGVCLGAQLIAASLGARVFASAEPEIGWFPIEPVPGASPAALGSVFREQLEVFHWHGESCELPAGAVPLARSSACENQAFAIGDRVLGLQFHLETTPAGARALIEKSRGDLVPGRWVQTEEEMLRRPDRFRRIRGVLWALLGRLQELAARRAGRDEPHPR